MRIKRFIKLLFKVRLLFSIVLFVPILTNAQLRTTSSADVYLCVNKSVGISTTPTGGTTPYTYSWTPAASLSASNVANPTATPTATTAYVVTITDANSNSVIDTVVVYKGIFPPKINVIPSVDTLCGTDTIDFDIENLQTCNTSGVECLTGSNSGIIAPSTFQTSAATVSPFHVTAFTFNTVRSNKKQFIIQPKELAQMGLSGKTNITSLGFFTSSPLTTWQYDNFTIKVGCSTDSTYVSTAFKTGLKTVFVPKTVVVPIATGWMDLKFDKAYTWDGTSSLVFEVCFSNSFDQGFNGPTVQFSNIVGQSVLLHNVGSTGVCNTTTGLFALTSRPNVQIGHCRVTSNAPMTYTWSPTTGLSSPSIYDPTAIINTSGDYILTVMDTNGCTTEDTAKIVVANDFTLTTPNDTNLCSPGNFAVAVTDNAGPGVTYSWQPAAIMTNPNASSTSATIPFSTEISVDVKSAGGCLKSDTFMVNVLPPINLDIATPDSTICLGDSIEFDVKTDPISCLTTSQTCQVVNPTVVGSGTNSLSGSAASPFAVGGVSHKSLKKQIILRSTELIATGITEPSLFSSLTLNFSNVQGNTLYENFTIKMNCTSANEFNFTTKNEFESPLQTVFNTKNVNIVAGSNLFTFDNSFIWDGTTNIIIEFCYENSTILNLATDIQTISCDFPGYGASLTKSSAGSACGDLTGGFISFIKPQMTFGVCNAPPRNDISYLWTPASGVNDDTLPEPKASPAATTAYILTGTVKNSSCEEKDTINVTVAPSFNTTTSNDTTLCLPDTLPIFVSHTSPSATTIEWQPSSSVSNSTTAATNAFLPKGQEFIVKLNSGGCVKFDTVQIEVLDVFNTNLTADKANLCADSSTQLFAEIEPICNVSNSNNCNGASKALLTGNGIFSTTSLTISPFVSIYVSSKRQYLFRPAELTAAGMTAGAKISDLSFDINSVGFTSEFEDFTVKVGCTPNTFLTSNFVSGTKLVYEPKSLYINPGINVLPFDYQYIWDGVSSLVVEICYVNTGTTSPFLMNSNINYVTTSYNSSLMIGSSVPICQATTGGTFSHRPLMEFGYCNGGSSFTYNWTPANTLNTSTNFDPVAKPDTTTTYKVTITDINSGCVYEDSIPITISDFDVSINNDTTLCNSQGFQLFVNTNATAPVSYQWDPALEVSNPTSPNPTVLVDFGNYYVGHVTDASGCTQSDTVILNYHPAPNISITGDTTVCRGDNLNLFIFGGSTYSWTPIKWLDNPLAGNPVIKGIQSSTKYLVEIVDQFGCIYWDSVEVDLHPSPPLDLGEDSTYCSDFSTELTIGNGFSNYIWSTGDTSNSIIATPPGIYSVSATDKFNCKIKDTVEFSVLPSPTTDFKSDYQVCENDSLTLSAKNDGSTFIWSTGETTQNITIKDGGDYWVEIDNGNCIGIDSFAVESLEFPVSGLIDSIFYCENEFPYGVPVKAGPPKYEYLWSNGFKVNQVELAEPGDYIVVITNGPNNCSVTDTVNVALHCGPAVFVPNSFTPNNDQINDTYKVSAKNIFGFEFTVYNRWGEVVYITYNENFEWDGTYDGKLLKLDAYVWVLKYEERLKDGRMKTRTRRGKLLILP